MDNDDNSNSNNMEHLWSCCYVPIMIVIVSPTYVDSCNAHKHMAGFLVCMDTVLEGIYTESDDLKL